MEAETLKSLVVGALEDLKAVNTVTLDVTAMTDVMDFLVITSGTSSTSSVEGLYCTNW